MAWTKAGPGRPKGAVNRLSAKAVEAAQRSGELPHEFLLRIARGEEIDGHRPTFQERMAAAQASAPYYAPKLASVEQRGQTNVLNVIAARPMTKDEWVAKYVTPKGIEMK
jgi:hypothetical protein